ncbi:MAG: hypothetical protein AABY22_17915 [Nanoarchaeota archaeon]
MVKPDYISNPELPKKRQDNDEDEENNDKEEIGLKSEVISD